METQPNPEKQVAKVQVARSKDWEAYKVIRMKAIEQDDEGMLGEKAKIRDLAKSDQQWQEDLDRKDMIIFLVWEGLDVVGMLQGIKEKQEGVWFLYAAFTKKESRGGIFPRTALVEIENKIKEVGGSKILIGVKARNSRAIYLYKLLGFKKVNQVSAKVEEFLSYLGKDGGFYMEKDLFSKDKK